jgi:hypothetical protein
MIQHEFKIWRKSSTSKGSDSADTSPQEEYPASLTQLSEDALEQEVKKYYDANDEHQPTEGKIQQEEQQHYDSIMKIPLDLSIVDLCSELCKLAKPPHVVFMVIDNLCASSLLELQQELQNRFKQADAWLSDLSTDDIRQLIAYVSYINDLAHVYVGHADFGSSSIPGRGTPGAGALILILGPLSRCLQIWILIRQTCLTRSSMRPTVHLLSLCLQ